MAHNVYVVAPGSTNTVRWCIDHPRAPNRDLILGTQSFPEGITPSPVCVGRVFSTICFSNGLRVAEHDVFSTNNPVTEFHTGDLEISNAVGGCPFF